MTRMLHRYARVFGEPFPAHPTPFGRVLVSVGKTSHPLCGPCWIPPVPLMSMFVDMRKLSATGL